MIHKLIRRIPTDPRDKITTGKKSDKGYPMGLDYFNVEKFPELIAVYGMEPQKLLILCPTNNPLEFFDCNYVFYKGKEKPVKVRTCDGEECIHRIAEKIGTVQFQQGQVSECLCTSGLLPEDSPERCKYVAYLKAYILNPTTGQVINPSPYLFETHSENSGSAIYSELCRIRDIHRGVLTDVPFMLSVKMAESKQSAAKKFPIWTLQVSGFLDDLVSKQIQRSENVNLLPEAEILKPQDAKPQDAKPQDAKPQDAKPQDAKPQHPDDLFGASAVAKGRLEEIQKQLMKSLTLDELLKLWESLSKAEQSHFQDKFNEVKKLIKKEQAQSSSSSAK